MLSTTAVSVAARRVASLGYRGLVRIAVAAAILVGGIKAADAQTTIEQKPAEPQTRSEKKSRWEFDVPTGTVIPTGAQRGAVERGHIIAAQLSYLVRPDFAITALLGWTRSRDIDSIGEPKLDVFAYDLGAEARAPRWIAYKAISFSPFAGGGAGARSYNYRNLDVDARHNVAAYVSAGGEIGVWRVGLRIEVRDYMTSFKPLAGGGTADARNDVVVMTGLRVCFRQACAK